jgi:hypothetical protein
MTKETLTTSRTSWTSSPLMTSRMDKIVFAWLKVRVCTLVILAIQFFAPLRIPLILMTFSMFQVHPKISYQCIDLHLIIMFILNFILSYFWSRTKATRRNLFIGPCYRGLYPLMHISNESSKHAFITIKLSSSPWHHCLGHPYSFIVQQVLKKKQNRLHPWDHPISLWFLLVSQESSVTISYFHQQIYYSLETSFFWCMGSCSSLCWETCILCKNYWWF